MNSGDRAVYQGYEVCLWPLEYVGITAGPSASNHIVNGVADSGLYDNGWYLTQIRNLYAPCELKMVSYTSAGNTQVWVSTNPVWCPGYQTPQYISIGVSHCGNPPYTSVGTIVSQGALFYTTGTYGASAYHVHFILEMGTRSSAFPVGYNAPYATNIYYSPNPPGTIADMFYLAPTDLIRNDGGYSWTTWSGTITTDNSLLAILYMNLNKRRKKYGKRIYS